MDFIVKFKVNVANKDNSISRKYGEIDISCDLTLEEFKMIQNEPDVLLAIKQQLKNDYRHKVIIDVEVYEIIEKKLKKKYA